MINIHWFLIINVALIECHKMILEFSALKLIEVVALALGSLHWCWVRLLWLVQLALIDKTLKTLREGVVIFQSLKESLTLISALIMRRYGPSMALWRLTHALMTWRNIFGRCIILINDATECIFSF